VARAETLHPDQDTAAAGPDRLAENLGEVRRLAGRFAEGAVA
jgi:hypothetical protein